MENPDFLKKKYALQNTPEVAAAAHRTEVRTGEKVNLSSNEGIQNYLDRFREIIERTDPTEREMGIQALKKVLLDKFVTKFEEIPESWHVLNERIIRERGQGGDWGRYSPEQKQKERHQQAEAVLADQEASLEQWIDYLASPDSSYMPDYIKYWTFRSISDLSEYDKEKGEFPKRSKGTVKMFPDINHEALGYIIDAVLKKQEGAPVDFGQFTADLSDEQKETFKKSLTSENFAKLYGWANEQIHPIAKHLLPITEGEWVKYEQDTEDTEHYKDLNQAIRGRGTGWCTAGENTAKTQLQGGDFYCYYTLDDNQKPTIPRIAIRMEGGKIAEVRGIAFKQNLDPYMGEVLAEKLEAFPDKKEFLKKDSDMQTLTALERKAKKGEQLDKDDLMFLYEMNAPIEGFGYQKDPRINELRSMRNLKEDLLVIFELQREDIATSIEEITEHTKLYAGAINNYNLSNMSYTDLKIALQRPTLRLFDTNSMKEVRVKRQSLQSLDYEELKKTDRSKIGEVLINPESLAVDWENVPFEKIKSFEFKEFVGKPRSELARHIIQTYSDKYIIPDITYREFLMNNPDKVPAYMKDGNYYYFYGSTLRDSGGDASVPCVDWNGGWLSRNDRWLDTDWRVDDRVVLLEK